MEDAELARTLAASIAGGADMVPLIRRHSVRHGSADGILTVYEPQAEVYGEVWMNLAMSAPLGQLQGPIQTKGGYSVFRVLDRQPESYYEPGQKRVRRDLESGVRAEKKRARFSEYLEGLRRQYASRVRVYPDRLAKVAAPAPSDSSRTSP